MSWKDWSKTKKLGVGCLGLLVVLFGCLYSIGRSGEKALESQPPAARTATVAAKNATDTPEPTEGPTATKAPDIGSEDTPAGIQTPVGENGASAWVVGALKDHGNTINSGNQFIPNLKTSGKFLQLAVGIRNLGDDAYSILPPSLVDAAGREYEPRTDAFMLISDERKCLLESINPGIDRACDWIYEVPTDATGLLLRVQPSFLGKARYIEIIP